MGAVRKSGLQPSGIFRGDDDERINYLADKVIYNVRKFKPDIVLIEGYAYSKNMRGVATRHEMYGVIKNRLLKMEQPYLLVTPTALKKFGTGNGKADKTEMIYAAKERLIEMGIPRQSPRSISDSDRADAFWLAILGAEDYESFLEAA